MKVPMTVLDYIERAELVYGNRVAVVDEPDQPAASWDSITYREMAERARAQAAGLDALGVAHGERVAIVSHNSARLLTSFFGVSGYGRIVVPVNFRLSAEEVAYIVDHCGASVLLVDPELEPALGGIEAKHRFVLGANPDGALYHYGFEPYPWAERSEDETASINYTSGTTARPKGVQITHRNAWLNATSFGWTAGVSEREVYLPTLPLFHCNGWGMPYAITSMGVKQVVLRKVDGEDILGRIERHGVTLMCGAPAVVAAVLDAAAARNEAGKPVPVKGTVRMVAAGAPPPSKT